MASNDVDRIYQSLNDLEQKINKLGKDKNVLKRISDLEKDMTEVNKVFQVGEQLLEELSKLNPINFFKGK